MYHLIRKCLFSLEPEVSHDLSLKALGIAEQCHVLKPFVKKPAQKPVTVMGLTFPNCVGLAAGLDKNADYFNALGALGFGFVEVGTVTPRPQSGNPKPRLFRLEKEFAIINRMGFNNKGVDHLVTNVIQRKYKGVLGINIGKNKDTAEENALQDYQHCMESVYPYADYITVNISSPNTPGLRDLQFGNALNTLLEGIKEKQQRLQVQHGRYVPVAVKIAPDMDEEGLQIIANTFLEFSIDGIIATNTTLSRKGVENSPFKDEAGGLSGRPVRDASTQAIKVIAETVDKKIPIIGVGGIMNGIDAKEKLDAGASLVQLYSGFIYRGPELIGECVF